MSRLILITAGAWAILGATIGWAAETGLDRSGLALDLRFHEGRAARVESLPGAAGGIRVTFQPADWPSVPLSGPRRPGVGLELPGIPPAGAKEP